MSPGTKVESRAQVYANQRMRSEILPLLGDTDPRLARLWNPIAVTGRYELKLRLPDKLVLQIMRSDDLMARVEEIVVDSVFDAMLDEPEAFVTDLLASLIGK
jgi:hypothetical protein